MSTAVLLKCPYFMISMSPEALNVKHRAGHYCGSCDMGHGATVWWLRQSRLPGWGKDILANCGGSVTWQNLWENNPAIMKRLYFDPLIPLLGVFLSK